MTRFAPPSKRSRNSRRVARRRLFLEPLEDRRVLAGLWYQNPVNPYDVNVDGVVNGIDSWHLHQELLAGGERALTDPNGPVQFFTDVSGDDYLSPLDQELLLRYLTDTLGDMIDPDLLTLLASEEQTGESTTLDSSTTSTMSCPSISLDPVGSVNEGSAFAMTGSVSPPGMYFFEANVNWGQSPGDTGMGWVGTNPDGSFSIPHIYFDDGPSSGNGTPQDIETISVSATINGCSDAANTTVTIHNTAPVPELVLFNTNNPHGGPEWQVSGSIQDASMSDLHTITIHWGDGSPPTVVNDLPTNQLLDPQPLHRYLPRQIHEGPIPYFMTVTVVDDDTGAALWEPIVPQYVLDLDNDANNNDLIEPSDDPIENVLPGRFLLVNTDDDNVNEVTDLLENPVSGEDDLEPFELAWMPRGGFDYTGWHLTLHAIPPIDPASGTIWQFADKSGWSVPFTASSGLIKEWVLGTGSVIETYYLEAATSGEIGLQLRLWTDYGLMVEEDAVVFTAFGSAVDIDIGYSQTYEMIEDEELEFTEGSFTVANQNDSDGDGVIDCADNIVSNIIQDTLWIEVDLMPLVIHRPVGYSPDKSLSLDVSGTVNFWSDKAKLEQVDIDAFINDWVDDVLEKTVWVEACVPSEALRDIVLELSYPGAMPDKVSATGVWATQTAVEHDKKTAAQIFAQYPQLGGPNDITVHSRVRELIAEIGGTGLQLPPGSVNNAILIEFTMTPPGINEYAKPGKHLLFDVTRRMNIGYETTDGNAGVIDPPNDQRFTHHFPFPDLHPDAVNDDPDYQDESHRPDSQDRMYSVDAPGLPTAILFPGIPEIQLRTLLGDFEEFVRVKIGKELEYYVDHPNGGTNDPEAGTQAPEVVASRTSNKFEWTVGHFLQSNGTKLVRSTGDVNESDENYVREPGN